MEIASNVSLVAEINHDSAEIKSTGGGKGTQVTPVLASLALSGQLNKYLQIGYQTRT